MRMPLKNPSRTSSRLNRSARKASGSQNTTEQWGEHRGSWGIALWCACLAFMGGYTALNFIFGFIPFGSIFSMLCTIPLAVLLAEIVFTRLSGGVCPTLLQGLVLLLVAFTILEFSTMAGWVTLMTNPDFGGIDIIYALGTIAGVMLLQTGYGIGAMYFWEQHFFD